MAGLSRNHHGQLNKMGITHDYDAMRQEYASDPLALEQIDIYDGNSAYHKHNAKLRCALKTSDASAEGREDAWFQEHYPCTAATVREIDEPDRVPASEWPRCLNEPRAAVGEEA